jgi:predicted acyltransferase
VEPTTTSPSSRIAPLDVLRGLTIAAMILVNNPGDWTAVYEPLLHTYWTGITFADVVFPAFVFIMGASIPFALARRLAAGASMRDQYLRMARRALALFALGLSLNGIAAVFDNTPLRVPGVLQRLALAYVLASIVVVHVGRRLWFAVVALVLVGHWALLTLVPFGGHPAGTLTPEHNIARHIDVSVFGRHSVTIPNDPEGIAGTLPAAATAILGGAAGDVIRRAPGYASAARMLGFFGVTFVGLGYIWSSVLLPSKPLWTGSFVLITAGLTALALAGLCVAVDARGRRRWLQPFLWLGVNPLAIYVLSEIVRHVLDATSIDRAEGMSVKAWLYWDVIAPAIEPWSGASASLIMGISYVTLWIVAAGVLYRFRIRINI